MKILLVSFSYGVPYRALRCAAAAGLTVHVLGNDAAARLRRSRYCAEYVAMTADPADPAAMGSEIDFVARRLDCRMVLPSDHVSFHLMARLKQRLRTPVFPLPEADRFDVLNDKRAFARHCAATGIPHPETEPMTDVGAIRAALAQGRIRLPFVVKPPAEDGASGVRIFRSAADLALLDQLDYAPLLVQRYIEGRDVDATVFAREGKVLVGQSYYRDGWRLVFDRNAVLLEQSARLVEALGVDGVFNFDARVSRDDGRIYMIECNPRFFYTMDYAALAGVNYVALGLGRGAAQPVRGSISFSPPLATLKSFIRLRWPSLADLRALRHFLADPLLPLIYEEIPWRVRPSATLRARAVNEGDPMRSDHAVKRERRLSVENAELFHGEETRADHV